MQPVVLPIPYNGPAAIVSAGSGGVSGVKVGPGDDGSIAPSAPTLRSAVPPVPINGGTLLVTDDGLTAVAADPDRDRIVLVDLEQRQRVATIALDPGDEPGRLVQEGRRVHVVLRRAGQVASIDLDTYALLGRREVCAAPQGIAYAPTAQALLVACTSGELVTLPAAGGPAARRVHVDSDLRDVIVTGERLFVTRFKRAELLELNAEGGVLSRSRPEAIQGPFGSAAPSPTPLGDPSPKTFEAAVAWRTVAAPDGSFSMLHQRVQVDAIELAVHSEEGESKAAPNGGSEGGSAYGSGGASCDMIVRSSASRLGGPAPNAGPLFAGVTLAVDAAVSPDGQWLALAVAGGSDRSMLPIPEPIGAVVMPNAAIGQPSTARCAAPGLMMDGGMIGGGQVIAVAFDRRGNLLLQTRDPNRIRVVAPASLQSCIGCEPAYLADVDLGGEPRRDTGHDLFHTDAGAGLACASCHPGGADDGHTWNFAELGPRRTQLMNMGVRDTLPLHWDGDLPTFQALVDEVFMRRMGGPELSSAQVELLSDWVDSLVPNAPMRTSDDPAAARGRSLFESEAVGCAGCHNGAKFTNNMTVDVGTGGALQVPSLIGVAYHQPYIHTGCAQSLRDRFDPSCGGDRHGNTAQLKDTEIDDLVAYLESL